jgi:Na+/phosphate symporter
VATLDDAYNQLVTSNGHLTDIHNDVQAVNTSVQQVDASVQQTTATVQTGLSQLGNLVSFTNQLLAFEIAQNQTIICNLEKISKQTCELVNQATRQTAAQEAMREELSDVKQLFELVNPAAAVEQHRLERLEQKLNECCPPPKHEPPCQYEPCPAPKEPPQPPNVIT